MSPKDDKHVASKYQTEKSTTSISFTKKKIIIISVLIFILIVLLNIIITYMVSVYISNKNNKEISTSIDDVREIPNSSKEPQIPGSSHKMIYRNIWGGRPPLYERPQKVPVKYVIISHTAGALCYSVTDCSKQMNLIQNLHVEKGSPDIGYNFLIGGDTNIYVARGWDNHNFHMNLDTIGICFMGNYIYDELTPGMIETAHQLLRTGVKQGKLDKDYILVAQNQTFKTNSPGQNVYEHIKFWPHYSPVILTE